MLLIKTNSKIVTLLMTSVVFQQACSSLKSLVGDTPENIFCLTQASAMTKCSLTYTAEQQNLLKAALAEKKVSSLYYAYVALTNMKVKGEFVVRMVSVHWPNNVHQLFKMRVNK